MNGGPAIEVAGASKRYGDVVAVDGLDLEVGRGEIYGFLGLNGAGKTTTIRMLLGMVRPSSGVVRLLGEEIRGGTGPWRRVGHLVESPASYPELTVRENLEVARRLYRMVERAATDAAIERLDLGVYADRRAGTLSTGNRQRLGLAKALLTEPELVILDEPANGLDPAGVVQVRELIGELSRERGVTVFMSSHVLGEVDRLATRVGVLHRGRLVEELDAGAMARARARWLSVDARDRVAAGAVLERAGYRPVTGPAGIRLEEGRALEAPDEVARVLAAAGVPPTRLVEEQEDLEARFLRLTGGAR